MIEQERKTTGEAEVASDAQAGLIQYLSVFILLLAFFILLNAVSNFEKTKVDAVLTSVDRAFDGLGDRASAGLDRQREQAIAEAAAELSGLRGELGQQVAGLEVSLGEGGRTLMLSLPVDEMVTADTLGFALRSDREAMVARLAAILRPRAAGVGIRLDGLTGTSPGGVDRSMAVAVGGVLARALVAAEAPVDAISVGYEPGEGRRLRLFFAITIDGRPVAEMDSAGEVRR